MASSIEQIANEEVYRCGYCFLSGDDLVDPRILPCGHSFCYACICNDYRNGSTLDCPICRFKHTDLIIKDLPSFKNGKTDTCGICEEIAELCCNQCSINLCNLHAKEHDELFASPNKFYKHQQAVAITVQSRSFKKEDKQFCTLHPEVEVKRACVRCYKCLCLECALEDKCSDDKIHHAEKIENLSEKLRKYLSGIMDGLNAKLNVLSDREKEANLTLAKKQQSVEEMKAVIDKTTTEQINEILEHSKRIKALLDDTFRSTTQTVKEYCDGLTICKDSTHDLRKEIHGIINVSPDFEVIKMYKRTSESAAKILESMPFELSLPVITIKQTDKRREAEIEIKVDKGKVSSFQGCSSGKQENKSPEPRCITYVKSSGSSLFLKSTGISFVQWLPDRFIANGFNDSIQMRNSELEEIKCHSFGGTAGSMCRYGEELLVLIPETYPAFNGCRIDSFSKDCKYLSTMVYGPEGNYGSHMVVIKDHVLLTDLGNKCFKLYEMNRDHVMDISFASFVSNVAGMCGLDDNYFLVSDDQKGKVVKFKFQPNSSPVWVCDNLSKPTGIDVDMHGYIFVTSMGLPCIYLLQPSGILLKQFAQKSNFFLSISISGKDLAVGTNNDIHCFKIDY